MVRSQKKPKLRNVRVHSITPLNSPAEYWRKYPSNEKIEREERLRKEAGKRSVEQAKKNRRARADAKQQRVFAKEQKKRDEFALAVWAATRIQSGYRGRRDRIYGNRRRVVVLVATQATHQLLAIPRPILTDCLCS